jgi:hypothetical protein
MIPPVDTKNSHAVAEFLQEKHAGMFAGRGSPWISRVFGDVTALFTGGNPDYAPLQLRYHNFEHTLQATVCLVMILEGREHTGTLPRLTARQFELAVVAMLLHDCGFLRLRSDQLGTGAKYTFIHELRSSAYAASYLPTVGALLSEVNDVVDAISCTGPNSQIGRIQFRDAPARMIACAVATADFLAQMAAPDYLEKLAHLYWEFNESHDFFGTPESDRDFKSPRQLLHNTPQFWSDQVLPKLEGNFEGVYRYLAAPSQSGHNPYLAAIEANIAKIKRIAPATS